MVAQRLTSAMNDVPEVFSMSFTMVQIILIMPRIMAYRFTPCHE
jgi:hypothetical protein